jgi:1-acyl-sn-glycerol-3-phosphate acyltransferase
VTAIRHGCRVVRTLLGFLHVWFVARFVAPRLGPAARARVSRELSIRTLTRLGLAVHVRGARNVIRVPCLLVANHVSWLDVQVLNALVEARFVAKSETRRWPIVGGIARGFGTFFLCRASLRDAARAKDAVARALAGGETVAVFPEGTTTEGTSLRRFHPAFFQAAIDAGVGVQPIALRYRRPDGSTCREASFVGDMTFLESVSGVVREPALTVEVTVGGALAPHGRDRRELAAAAQRCIATALALPPESVEPSRAAPPRPRRSAA